MSKGLGQLTPEEVVKRCRARGARVEERSGRFVIYPPDPKQRPLALSRVRMQGRHAQNLVAELRRIGLDIMSDTPADEELIIRRSEVAPPPLTQSLGAAIAASDPDTSDSTEEDVVAAPTEPERTNITGDDTPYTQRPKVVPFDYRRAYEDLKAQVARLAERLDGAETTMLTELEQRDARVDEMDARLETVAPKPKPKPRSVAELVQVEILRYFAGLPLGFKLSPSSIEGNAGDRMPAKRAVTTVAHACRELVGRGELAGGGRAGQPGHGLYWSTEETRAKAAAGTLAKAAKAEAKGR